MKMLTGFLSPTSGTATVCGYDVLADPMGVKRSIGYLPEGAPLYPDMTPRAFLEFIAELRGLSGAAARSRVDEVVARVNIEAVLHQSIETLSKGYKRRVGLAQAILHDPPVLVLDEPTDGLDPNQKHEVRTLIDEMSADKVIVLSTHILEEVEAVCSRAIIIANGKLVSDCTPAELMARSRFHNAVSLSLRADSAGGAADALRELESIDAVEEQTSDNGTVDYVLIPKAGRSIVSDVSEKARNANWQIDGISVQRGRLDDVFRELTNPSDQVRS